MNIKLPFSHNIQDIIFGLLEKFDLAKWAIRTQSLRIYNSKLAMITKPTKSSCD